MVPILYFGLDTLRIAKVPASCSDAQSALQYKYLNLGIAKEGMTAFLDPYSLKTQWPFMSIQRPLQQLTLTI